METVLFYYKHWVTYIPKPFSLWGNESIMLTSRKSKKRGSWLLLHYAVKGHLFPLGSFTVGRRWEFYGLTVASAWSSVTGPSYSHEAAFKQTEVVIIAVGQQWRSKKQCEDLLLPMWKSPPGELEAHGYMSMVFIRDGSGTTFPIFFFELWNK